MGGTADAEAAPVTRVGLGPHCLAGVRALALPCAPALSPGVSVASRVPWPSTAGRRPLGGHPPTTTAAHAPPSSAGAGRGRLARRHTRGESPRAAALPTQGSGLGLLGQSPARPLPVGQAQPSAGKAPSCLTKHTCLQVPVCPLSTRCPPRLTNALVCSRVPPRAPCPVAFPVACSSPARPSAFLAAWPARAGGSLSSRRVSGSCPAPCPRLAPPPQACRRVGGGAEGPPGALGVVTASVGRPCGRPPGSGSGKCLRTGTEVPGWDSLAGREATCQAEGDPKPERGGGREGGFVSGGAGRRAGCTCRVPCA